MSIEHLEREFIFINLFPKLIYDKIIRYDRLRRIKRKTMTYREWSYFLVEHLKIKLRKQDKLYFDNIYL